MSTLDWAVVAGYVLVIFSIALWPTRKSGSKDSEQYFLAGRNAGWFVIGASIFASNIGSEHIIGLAGAGAAGNAPAAQFEIIAVFALLILGWLFVPFYLKSGVYTMPEFLEKRYSVGPRYYLAVLSVISYVLTKISVTIAAGGIVFETLMGVSFWTGAIIVVIATGIYTIFGGLRAVLYTDVVQMFLLIGGSVAVTVIGLDRLGGWQGLRASVEPQMFDLWRAASDPEFPWTGIIFGAPILGVWYWCTDQYIVQRTLAARSINAARKGTIFAAYLKLLPIFIFLVPGIIASALMKQGVINYDSPDQSLPAMIGTLLPAGFKGLVLAGMLAALMSSLSSVFNSCSTIVTMDLYRHMDPRASERRLVIVGQMVTVLLVVLALAWIPVMSVISSSLYTYLQSVQAYISPPIAAVFLMGLLWRRANTAGAMTALITGFVLGAGRLLLEVNKSELSGLWLDLVQINFLHFAILMFALSIVVMVAVGLVTTPPAPEKIERLVLRNSAGHGEPQRGTRANILLSAGVLVGVAAIWIYFS